MDTGVTTGKRLRWIRSKQYKLADDATLHKILNPPPPPAPEFKPDEYITGVVPDTKYLYKCHEPNCRALFTTETSLLIHKIKHLNRNLKCTFCETIHKTEDELSQHYKDFHPDLQKNPDADPLQCKRCNKVCRDAKALRRHIRTLHHDKIYPCPYCQFPFSNPDSLKRHVKSKHYKEEGREAPKFPCKICGKEFCYINSLRSHIREAHRGKPYDRFKCIICSTSYSCKKSYNRHMKDKHSNPTFYPCHISNVKFMVQQKLSRHNKSLRHLNNARRASRMGHVPFIASTPVIKTVKTINPNLSNEQLVELCKKTVVKIQLRRVDEFVVKQAPTSICSKKATSATYLNCIYCDKSLPNLDAVKSHESICFMKIRGAKVNVCHLCDKEFVRPYLLKIHAREHMDERSFNCSYCETGFKSMAAKNLHEKTLHFGIRTPTRPRVHKCEYPGCGKEFTKLKCYRGHRDTVHLGLRFTCKECGKVYRREDILDKHLRDHEKCSVRLECKHCNRSYASKATYLSHLLKRRHLRKVKEFEKQVRRGDLE